MDSCNMLAKAPRTEIILTCATKVLAMHSGITLNYAKIKEMAMSDRSVAAQFAVAVSCCVGQFGNENISPCFTHRCVCGNENKSVDQRGFKCTSKASSRHMWVACSNHARADDTAAIFGQVIAQITTP